MLIDPKLSPQKRGGTDDLVLREDKAFQVLYDNHNYQFTIDPINEFAQPVVPTRADDGSVGYDLAVPGDIHSILIMPGEWVRIPLGFRMQFPLGCWGLIASRSGLALKHQIRVEAGVVDPSYRGEISVLLSNNGKFGKTFFPGDRIAQLMLMSAITTAPVMVGKVAVDTQRGEGGFGSTGN